MCAGAFRVNSNAGVKRSVDRSRSRSIVMGDHAPRSGYSGVPPTSRPLRHPRPPPRRRRPSPFEFRVDAVYSPETSPLRRLLGGCTHARRRLIRYRHAGRALPRTRCAIRHTYTAHPFVPLARIRTLPANRRRLACGVYAPSCVYTHAAGLPAAIMPDDIYVYTYTTGPPRGDHA